jgi:hypothetical protein
MRWRVSVWMMIGGAERAAFAFCDVQEAAPP